MKRFGKLSLAALLLCAAILSGALAACSSNYASSSAAVAGSRAAMDRAAAPEAGQMDAAVQKAGLGQATGTAENTSSSAAAPSAPNAAANAQQKVIERLNYQIETLKFDDSVSRIQSLSNELGGYVQESSVTGSGILEQKSLRQASYVLRIPQEKLGQMKSRAGEIGSILNFSSSSEDVSDQYYDTEARLKSLRTQQTRLLELLKKSGSLADVVALEKALADVNYQIESLTGTLKHYDSLVNYSTVTVQLSEVAKPTEIERTPVTLGERISQQFRQSVRGLGRFGEGLLVFFLGGSPVILLLLVLAAAVLLLIRRSKKRRGSRAARDAARLSGSASGPEPERKEPGPDQPEKKE